MPSPGWPLSALTFGWPSVLVVTPLPKCRPSEIICRAPSSASSVAIGRGGGAVIQLLERNRELGRPGRCVRLQRIGRQVEDAGRRRVVDRNPVNVIHGPDTRGRDKAGDVVVGVVAKRVVHTQDQRHAVLCQSEVAGRDGRIIDAELIAQLNLEARQQSPGPEHRVERWIFVDTGGQGYPIPPETVALWNSLQ